jgi:hypothetical protein
VSNAKHKSAVGQLFYRKVNKIAFSAMTRCPDFDKVIFGYILVILSNKKI